MARAGADGILIEPSHFPLPPFDCSRRENLTHPHLTERTHLRQRNLHLLNQQPLPHQPTHDLVPAQDLPRGSHRSQRLHP